MRILYSTVVSLSVLLTTALATQAQDLGASPEEVARCAAWIKDTVPAKPQINGSDFCAGINRDRSSDGWYSMKNCGEQSERNTTKSYCASSGALGPDWTIAAGYIVRGSGGSKLTSEEHQGGTLPVVTLYSRTPLHIGETRIPAGFSRLRFSHTDIGWALAIESETEKVIRTVPLLSGTGQFNGSGKELGIGVNSGGLFHCSDFSMRELVFGYDGKDLYVCMRPDQIQPKTNESASKQ